MEYFIFLLHHKFQPNQLTYFKDWQIFNEIMSLLAGVTLAGVKYLLY